MSHLPCELRVPGNVEGHCCQHSQRVSEAAREQRQVLRQPLIRVVYALSSSRRNTGKLSLGSCCMVMGLQAAGHQQRQLRRT
jgi:hypothetical protein